MYVDEAFARVVWQELDARALTLPWLAGEAAIPERTLRNILRGGQATVKLHHVCAISQALGVSCAEMVARADALIEH